MAQNITLKIAGKEYALVAATPEMESRMRRSAEEINGMLAKYDERYPDRPAFDKLVFVTLNEAVGKLSYQESAKSLSEEAKSLEAEIASYLDGIEANR